MANLKSLAKDTAIYGLSSIVGRFLNYLLVPLYTHCISAQSGGYGVVTQLYALTALAMAVLTFGMETTFFRFVNADTHKPHTVFSTAMAVVGGLSLMFWALVCGFAQPLSAALGPTVEPQYLRVMSTVVALDALQAIPFCWLRHQRRAFTFAGLKLLFIGLNIGLNLVFFLLLGHTQAHYIFVLNLVCTALVSVCFVPMLWRVEWRIDFGLLRRMLAYSWPILVLGVMGILNQAADKMIFPLVYPDAQAGVRELGVYGACVKVAMIMAMITQAFRFAYEPFVFAQCRNKDQNATYAAGMKYFVVFTLLAFLCVMAWMPLLRHLIGPDYWAGLRVVPIVMVAEIMMGVYFNLSFWYKLTDRTIYGALFSLCGCAVLFAVNLAFIPSHSYMACAWGGLAGYGTAMVLSYVVGQRLHPIPYPMRQMALSVALAAALYGLMCAMPSGWPVPVRLAGGTVLVAVFAAHVVRRDMPLAQLPVVGTFFRKRNKS